MDSDEPPRPSPRPAINVLITLTINPAPERAADEFKLTATSATEGFSVDEPVSVGQYRRNGGQALTTIVRIYPSPPPEPPPPAVPWWLVKPDPIQFGQQVRIARERAGLSKAELARRTGLTEMTIRNIESGRVAGQKARGSVSEALAAAGQPLDPNRKD